MKIGIVGVGQWAKTMAGAFRKEGHEIIGHSRRIAKPVSELGPLVSVAHLLENSDGIVLATPPDVTCRLALECITSRIPTIASKPIINAELLLERQRRNADNAAPFFVDYVHLHSLMWTKLINHIETSPIFASQIDVNYLADGPIRDWGDGLLDFGPHAIAMLLDFHAQKADDVTIKSVVKKKRWNQKIVWEIRGQLSDIDFSILTGNGALTKQGLRRTVVTLANGQKASYEEQLSGDRRIGMFTAPGKHHEIIDHDPLSEMVRQFARKADERGSFESLVDLELSHDIEKVINKIRIAGG